MTVAVVVAGLATYSVAQYVDGLEAQAAEGAELVEVFVADGLIPANASAEAAINAGLVRRTEVLRRTMPEGAVAALDDVDGLIVLAPILPGEVLLHGRFGTPEQAGGSFEIPSGMQAMSVEVDVPIGVANIIQPGDRVSLIAHVDREEGDATTDEAGQALGVTASVLDQVVVEAGVALEFRGGWSQFILQGIEVLAIGERVVSEEEAEASLQATQGSVMMTLAVTPDQAERLALAVFEADLYATLLPDDAEVVEPGGVTLADLFR